MDHPLDLFYLIRTQYIYILDDTFNYVFLTAKRFSLSIVEHVISDIPLEILFFTIHSHNPNLCNGGIFT